MNFAIIGRLLRARPIRAVLVVLIAVVAWQAFLTITAPDKIASEVATKATEGEVQRVIVELRFKPQRFHTLELQEYGRVMRVDGDEVQLRSVQPGGVRALSHLFWVREIRPLEQ